MAIDRSEVKAWFERLEAGDAEGFFRHVADDVHWTVMGTHPLAGEYHDKQGFLESTFGRLNRVLRAPVSPALRSLFVAGEWAVVELEANATALNGEPFHNTYCWVLRVHDGLVREVRAYVDSAAVQRVIAENE